MLAGRRGVHTSSQISQPASAPVSAPTPVAQADPSGEFRFAAVTAAFRGACSDAACSNRFQQTLDLHAVLPRASYNATCSYTCTRGSQTGHHLVRTWLEITCQPKILLCSAAAFCTLLWQYTGTAASAVVEAAAAAKARSAHWWLSTPEANNVQIQLGCLLCLITSGCLSLCHMLQTSALGLSLCQLCQTICLQWTPGHAS